MGLVDMLWLVSSFYACGFEKSFLRIKGSGCCHSRQVPQGELGKKHGSSRHWLFSSPQGLPLCHLSGKRLALHYRMTAVPIEAGWEPFGG
ncbi:conserved hypothetical protein [Ricinus communis]|uniref:Uncharacterized protein n=1 Tax=Ricinus communis TaxID=3988 RepID=B9SBK2_RICCO|nr:conserved hypothetical protein [Ricinus communis]